MARCICMFTTGKAMQTAVSTFRFKPRAFAAGVLLASALSAALVQAPAWADTAPVWSTTAVAAASPTSCAQCGVVEAVTTQPRGDGSSSGLGAAAGAALGGWLANQFGSGDGKNFATILGMLGGTWAGNMLEKQFRQGTAFRIDVRMPDGSLRSIDHSSSLPVGSVVRVDGNSLSPVVPTEAETPGAVHTSV
jgi:outer membrane lipoprotein SlyB